MVTSNSERSKVGTASMESYLSLFATGDASIENATWSAKITKIHHVDYEYYNFLSWIISVEIKDFFRYI